MTEKTFDLISYEVKDRICWLTINNEERMNALSAGVNTGLWDAMEEATNDDDVLVVILIGAGGRAFSAGADLKAAAERGRTNRQEFPRAKSALWAPWHCPKPIIAAIDGYALAGGMQLAARCDIRVATEKSVFGMPEVRRSLVASGEEDTPERFFPPGEAMLMLLTAEHYPAKRAYDMGFIQSLVPDREALIAEATRIAETIKMNAPLAVQASKKLVQQSRHLSTQDGWELRNALDQRVRMSEDALEGPRAFVEKRDPVWKMR